MIQYGKHSINQQDIDAVVDVLGSDWLTTGPAVQRFEGLISKLAGEVPAIAVSSGTAALHAAYHAIGLKPGDEIISPPLTFIATQATAKFFGATIRFADVLEDTGTINPDLVQDLITDKTVAITAVDYAGNPCEMDDISLIAHQNGLYVIEDSAHSLGSTYKNRPVGSLADITTFSFFPTKNITTGEGGAITSSNPELLQRARRFARQGLVREPDNFFFNPDGDWYQEVHEFGLNYRLPDILAALGISQISRIQEFKKRRADIKALYDLAFADSNLGITSPAAQKNSDPMWHLYPLRVPAFAKRKLFDGLREVGIQCQVNYMPVYWHPVFAQEGYPRGLCPVAENYYAREISLPLHVGLSNSEVFTIASKVKQLLAEIV